MKSIMLGMLACLFLETYSQKTPDNIIIITTDGLRWQELFRGMDSALANDRQFNQDDSQHIFNKYWATDAVERRKKLFPFIWSTVSERGQIAGNRDIGSRVSVSNPHWFSYPGYSEIMTGYADTSINRNDYPPNPNVTILEFFNNQPSLRDKVAAFGAWNAFDRILNEQRSGVPVFSAFDETGGKSPSTTENLINKMRNDSYKPWLDAECLDVFTHYSALEYLKSKRPRVLYIAYGETDEWAHSGMYRSYLDAAAQVDAWLSEIWNWVQQDPRYKDRTTIFITTDHGRGDAVKKEWTSHGSKIIGSNETWFAVIGPGISGVGEWKDGANISHEQFAQTFAKLMGYTFKAGHPVGPFIRQLFNGK